MTKVEIAVRLVAGLMAAEVGDLSREDLADYAVEATEALVDRMEQQHHNPNFHGWVNVNDII